jgi:hypothetical protein
MIRLVIENLLLFLLPAFMYVTYTLIASRGQTSVGSVLDAAPLFWLFGAGALLVLAVLIMFGDTSGGQPGQAYRPPVVKDGRVVPGRSE